MPRIEDGVLYISNSSLSSAVHCDTRAWLSVHGYTNPQENAALVSGSAGHLAMQTYFLTGNKVAALHVFTKSYKNWAAEHVPQVDRLSYENMYVILNHWFDEHPLETLPYSVVPRMVELPFEYPLTPEGDIVLTGRPDAIVMGNDNTWAILDHKFRYKFSQGWWDNFMIDSQMTGYCWIAKKYLGLGDVRTVYINGIELSLLPSSDKRKCKVHGVKYQECAVQHCSSLTKVFYRTPWQVSEWWRTAVAIARNIKKILEEAPTVEDLKKVRTQGTFVHACGFCPYAGFCANNRPAKLIDRQLIPAEAEG